MKLSTLVPSVLIAGGIVGVAVGAIRGRDIARQAMQAAPAAPASTVVEAGAPLTDGLPAVEQPQGAAASELPADMLDPARIDAHVRLWIQRARLPGASVVIVQDGRTVYSGEFHRSDPTQSPRSRDPATPYLLGSVSKTVTAQAVMSLVQRGELVLDSPAVHYLPQLRIGGHAPLFTVRHLLQHRTGISRSDGLRSLDGAARAPLSYPDVHLTSGPGSTFEYSNLNYVIVGRILEEVTGEPFARVVAHEVFEPLSMTRSYAAMPAVPGEATLAEGHALLFLAAVRAPEPEHAPASVPAGFIAASAGDMARLVSAQMRQDAGTEMMRMPPDGAFSGYGLGWRVVDWTQPGTRLVAHDGLVGRYAAAVGYLPERGTGVVVLLNANAGVFQPVAAQMMRDLLTLAEGGVVEPPPRTEIIVRGIILLALLAAVFGFSRRVIRWSVAGRPRAMTLRDAVAPALGAVVAVAAVVVVPLWFGVPFTTMVAMQPDVAIALLVGALIALPDALLKTWLRSRERRLRRHLSNHAPDRFGLSATTGA